MQACVKVHLKHNIIKQTYEFQEKTQILIGRSESCQIVIPESKYSQVSRHHCIIDIDPPHAGIRDLNSRNGTFVNDQDIAFLVKKTNRGADVKIEGIHLHDGDVIMVGETTMTVEIIEG